MGKKQRTVKTLQPLLDQAFSIFIRLRDADSNGYVKCISCNDIKHWKDVDCGHFVNRKHMGTRYCEFNCNAQCRFCNRFDEGNNIGYTRGLIDKYGENIINLLAAKKLNFTKLTPFEYEVMLEEYRKKAREIAKEKGVEI